MLHKNNKNHKSIREMIDKTGTSISVDKLVKIFEESVQTKKWKNEWGAYENMCKNMKLECSEKNINVLMSARKKVERNPKNYIHTISMLKKLKNLGYKIGIVSNSSMFAIENMKKNKLFKYIDYPVFSFEVGAIKPDVKLYKATLKRAGAKPGKTIMIGDNLKNDVLSPRKLGMNAIHYKNYRQLKKDFRKFGINL